MIRQFAFLTVFCLCVFVPSVAVAQTRAVTIAWDANTEPGVIGYAVYIGTAPGVYSLVYYPGKVTQFTYHSGVSGRRYYFAVSAYAAGRLESPKSSEVSTVAGATPTAAPQPSAPVVPAVVLQPARVSGGMVTLTWSPVGGLTASEYLLEAGSAAGLSNLYNASVGAITSLSAHVGNGSYFVRVRGRARDGTVSARSNEVSFQVGATGQATCSAPPAPPADLAVSIAGTQASAEWMPAPGATSYLVQAGSAPGLSDLYHGNVGAVVSVSAEVPPGFSAYVRVVAVNGCGQSAPSTEILVQ